MSPNKVRGVLLLFNPATLPGDQQVLATGGAVEDGSRWRGILDRNGMKVAMLSLDQGPCKDMLIIFEPG